MADRGSLRVVRMIAVAIALTVAATVVIAQGVTAASRPHGFQLVDVLVAPIMLVFYAGPALLVIGMASRSRSMTTAMIALVLAGFFAAVLVAYRLPPWNLHRLGDKSDAGMQLFIVTLFLLWPASAGGGLLWRAIHRRDTK